MDVLGAEPPPIENGSTGSRPLLNNGTRSAIVNNGGPSLDLTLGIGINNNHGSEAIINLDDSDSESDGGSGGFGPDPFFLSG